jgi:retron-type reverse transcriptase
MAALLILEPIFEADFLDCFYGFRTGKILTMHCKLSGNMLKKVGQKSTTLI